jgi:hypothetical protein
MMNADTNFAIEVSLVICSPTARGRAVPAYIFRDTISWGAQHCISGTPQGSTPLFNGWYAVAGDAQLLAFAHPGIAAMDGRRCRERNGARAGQVGNAAGSPERERQAGSRGTFVSPDTKSADQKEWPRWFQKSSEKAGIDNFHFHDLRHTLASRLAMDGVDLLSIARLLGHSKITQTEKYAHLAPSHVREAVERIGNVSP